MIDGADARRRLAGIADAVADHDRAIVTRADDSVVRVVAGAPAFVRRARGFTPAPIRLAHEVPCVVALGAQLKATVTVTRGNEAFVSQHVGDLDTPAAVAVPRGNAAPHAVDPRGRAGGGRLRPASRFSDLAACRIGWGRR